MTDYNIPLQVLSSLTSKLVYSTPLSLGLNPEVAELGLAR